MAREVIVTDEYKIVAIDPMNWQVYRFKEVNQKDGTTEKKWVALASYHPDIKGAVSAIFKMTPKTSRAKRKDLKQFLEELEALTKRVEKAADKMSKAVK